MDVIRGRYWSFIPRRGSGRRTVPRVADDVAPRAVARARGEQRLTGEELTALFAEPRPAVIEEIRSAADELRARLAGETVTFVVNRNINISNVCVVGCAFCDFGQSRRLPDAYEHSEQEFAHRVQEAVQAGAIELCIQSGIHPDWGGGGLPGMAAVRQAACVRSCTCMRTRRWRLRTCATCRALRRGRCSPGCARPGWDRRPGPRRRCCTMEWASGSRPASCRSNAGSRSLRRRTRRACGRPRL
jgi:hypothetical protein